MTLNAKNMGFYLCF